MAAYVIADDYEKKIRAQIEQIQKRIFEIMREYNKIIDLKQNSRSNRYLEDGYSIRLRDLNKEKRDLDTTLLELRCDLDDMI